MTQRAGAGKIAVVYQQLTHGARRRDPCGPDLFPAQVTTEISFSLVRSLGFNHAEIRPRAGVIHLIAEKVLRRS